MRYITGTDVRGLCIYLYSFYWNTSLSSFGKMRHSFPTFSSLYQIFPLWLMMAINILIQGYIVSGLPFLFLFIFLSLADWVVLVDWFVFGTRDQTQSLAHAKHVS